MTKTDIAWDLSEIFPSSTDSSVLKAIGNLGRMAEEFAKKYQGKIASLSAVHLAECLREFEENRAKLGDVTLFSELSFAANMTLPETQSLHDRVMKIEAKLGKMLAFFELEVGALVSKNSRMISDPALANYRHALKRFKRLAAHHLSEVEEQLIIEKDQYGVKAWEELQMKWLNTQTFEVEVEGKKKKLPFGEASGLFPHPDRKTRESAYKSIYGLLSGYGDILFSPQKHVQRLAERL